MIKQLSIFVANKHGRLARITEVLAKNQIDIRALSIADTTDYGILRLIVNKPDIAEKLLKEEGMTVRLTEVIAVAIPDVPGGLAGAVNALYEESIAVEYMYAFLNPKDDTAFVIMRVEDNQKAINILEQKGYKIMHGDAIYTI